ncbi:MAG: copper chaperone PCu(A)C [Steroidobacteraceae bacterium]
MKILPRSFVLAMFALIASAAASAADLHVMQPWSRSTPPGVTVGVGYVMLHNLGPRPQVIVSATSPAAERVEMHETKRTPEGLTQMRPLEKVTVPPSGAFSFEPNGPHLMLVGLKAPLVTGQKVPVSLKFESGETVNFELEVRDLAATDDEHAAHR